MLAAVGTIVALALICVVFIDCFEAVILPRRVRHGCRFALQFYRTGWRLWRHLGQLFPAGRWRRGILSTFGPLSLFVLIAFWALGLILGFALLHASLETPLSLPRQTQASFATYLYFSGTTFFTLGYGDLVPLN